jgi:hypothetical protein
LRSCFPARVTAFPQTTQTASILLVRAVSLLLHDRQRENLYLAPPGILLTVPQCGHGHCFPNDLSPFFDAFGGHPTLFGEHWMAGRGDDCSAPRSDSDEWPRVGASHGAGHSTKACSPGVLVVGRNQVANLHSINGRVADHGARRDAFIDHDQPEVARCVPSEATRLPNGLDARDHDSRVPLVPWPLNDVHERRGPGGAGEEFIPRLI